MEKLTRISNDKLEKVSLNFSRFTNRHVNPLNGPRHGRRHRQSSQNTMERATWEWFAWVRGMAGWRDGGNIGGGMRGLQTLFETLLDANRKTWSDAAWYLIWLRQRILLPYLLECSLESKWKTYFWTCRQKGTKPALNHAKRILLNKYKTEQHTLLNSFNV